jgi:hypothetical protein
MHSPLTLLLLFPLLTLTAAQTDGATTNFSIDCNTNNVSGSNCQGTVTSYADQICSGCSGSLGLSSYMPSQVNAMCSAENIGPLDILGNGAQIQVVFKGDGTVQIEINGPNGSCIQECPLTLGGEGGNSGSCQNVYS